MLIGIDASRAVVARRTGTEVYSLHLIQSLLEIGTAHRFRLYFNVAPSPGLIPSVAHCEWRVMPFPRLWTHLRLSAEMLHHPPDVLFVPSHVLPIYHPRRSVVTVHDLGHHYYPGAHTPSQRRYLEWSTRYHIRTAAHLLADSQATRDDLVRVYGADPARIAVAHLGVDPALRPVRDPAAIAQVRLKYGISGPYLLHVGTLQPRKNLVRLVEAFAQVSGADLVSDADLQIASRPRVGRRSQPTAHTERGARNTRPTQNGSAESPQSVGHATRGPHRLVVSSVERTVPLSHREAWDTQHEPLQLVLAGKRGWLYDDILARVRALGLEGRVITPGFVDHADLAALYSGADLLVMPSLYEGFCMPVLEAMACGTPVVCSNVSSLPEVAGNAASLFDPQDVGAMVAAIWRALTDDGLRKTLIARGLDRVKGFTWERCARQVLGVLQRVGDARVG